MKLERWMAVGVLAFTALSSLPLGSATAQGREQWRYQIAAPYLAIRPVVARDGTVYALDIHGTLHAVRPNGTLKWKLSGVGNSAVSVGQDGTVYTGSTRKVVAVTPAGKLKWTYNFATAAHDMYGPTLGPDGNIYANGASGPGVLSLTPAGKLRWATPLRAGRPWVQHQEMVFRPASAKRGLQVLFSGNGRLAQVDAKDGKVTVVSHGGNNQLAIGPNGDVYSTSVSELRAFKPDTTLRWTYKSRFNTRMSDPSVGKDGVVYVVRHGTELDAVNPSSGARIWTHKDLSHLRFVTANPTNTMVLVIGRTRGNTDFVRAVDPRGSLMWQVDLGTDNQGAFPTTTARFTPDGNTAYIGAKLSQNTCALIAFDTSPKQIAEVWTWGRACRGVSTKLPLLAFGSRPRLGSKFSVGLAQAQPGAAAMHIAGFRSTRLPLDSFRAYTCTGYVTPDLLFLHKTDGSGKANTVLPLPNIAALAGLKLYHQFVVADPVNRAGLITTVGGGSVLGM